MPEAVDSEMQRKSFAEEIMECYVPFAEYMQQMSESKCNPHGEADRLYADLRLALYPTEMCLFQYRHTLEFGVIGEPCNAQNPYVCLAAKKEDKKIPILAVRRNIYSGDMEETHLDVILFGGKGIYNYFATDLCEIDDTEKLSGRYSEFKTRFAEYASQFGIDRINILRQNDYTEQIDSFPVDAGQYPLEVVPDKKSLLLKQAPA